MEHREKSSGKHFSPCSRSHPLLVWELSELWLVLGNFSGDCYKFIAYKLIALCNTPWDEYALQHSILLLINNVSENASPFSKLIKSRLWLFSPLPPFFSRRISKLYKTQRLVTSLNLAAEKLRHKLRKIFKCNSCIFTGGCWSHTG